MCSRSGPDSSSQIAVSATSGRIASTASSAGESQGWLSGVGTSSIAGTVLGRTASESSLSGHSNRDEFQASAS
eukprot:1408825-Rhodomonas_salina.1